MTDPKPAPHGRRETDVDRQWKAIWRALIIRGAILVAAVTLLGALLGMLFAGQQGLNGALIGGGLAAIFLLVSLVIMYIGRSWNLTAIAGALGVGFLFKAFIFMIVIWRIKDAAWLDGTTAFFTIVAAVLGTSLIDAITVTRARVPTVDPEAR
ncbi:hypothetical protein [Brevibacterium luteolum]|uniref:ATP synthase protein I n=1 Tax=Brevibacterium luteolum TaxID=199591 RepID=A0A2N6PK29_9MICO|nr:hypothetical protein [Brevibacterium luteolum]MCT1922062.1 hypothetical protein [Brevibacterium luteolum]PMB99028.1 hypothetical protein CJ198_00285 [Brevibacterium luteolum]